MTENDDKSNTFDGLEGSLENEQVSEDQAGVSQEEPSSEPEAVTQALVAKEEECKLLQEKYLRLAAEFENYKRLSQKDQRDQIRFGNEQLLRELLPVIDNLERAIKSARDNSGGDALVQGVELTLKQLVTGLAKFGVKSIDSVGKPFDPSAHQAVAQVASQNIAANSVVEEFQKGYLLHDRILRAAMVSVSTGPPADGPPASPSGGG